MIAVVRKVPIDGFSVERPGTLDQIRDADAIGVLLRLLWRSLRAPATRSAA